MSLQSTLKSLIWPFIEAISGILSGAVAVLVIARIIGAEAFGLGSIALGVVLIAQVGVNSLVHDALVRSEHLVRDDVDVGFTASVVAAIAIGLIVASAAPVVAYFVKHDAITILVWAFTPILVFSALPMTMIAERRRALDFNTVAIHQIIGRSVGVVLGVGAALEGAGVWSLVIQYTCASMYMAIAMYALAPRWPRLRFSWERLAPMLSFCSPIIASQLMIYATNWFFLFTMGRWHGLGAAGHWSVAMRLADGLFGGIMQAAYQVALASLALHQAARERLRDALVKGQALSGLVAIPLLVALAAAAEPLLQLLLGPGWGPAGQLALGPLVGSFLFLRQILPSTALRVIGISAVSLAATLANAATACAGLVLFGHYSPLAISAVYALSILPGYSLIYFVAARKFSLPVERGLAALGRDLALAMMAFALARSITGQLHSPSLLLKVAVAGSTAFLVAAVLLALSQRKFFQAVLVAELKGAGAENKIR
ncbi:MAG TPA: oligosaccharide flippase family protein [Pseudolabrys sp.]|nr:oligosaccharide flippase family protein [Pseudolabrys sp.]